MPTSLRERLPTARRHALLLALAVTGLVLLVASEELHGLLVGALPAAETLIRRQPVLGALAIIGFSALSAMLAFVSSALIVPVAVYVWGAPTSMLLIWVGWTMGGALSYALARMLGRQVAVVPPGAFDRRAALCRGDGLAGTGVRRAPDLAARRSRQWHAVFSGWMLFALRRRLRQVPSRAE